MKNSPDPEWLNRLSHRLGNYQEEPDDVVWKKISGAIRYQAEPYWLRWAHRVEAGTLFVLMIWSLMVFTDEARPVYYLVEEPRETVAKEKSSPVKIADPTLDNQSDTRSLAMTNHHGAVGEVGRATEVSGQHAMIVDRHKTSHPFFLSDVEVNISPVIRQTPSADSSKSIEPSRISSDQAEEEAPIIPARKKRPLVFYGSVSPSLGFHKISPFDNDGVSIESFYRKPVFSEDRFGLTIQGGLQWKVAGRVEVYSGLLLYSQSQVLAYHYLSGENGNLSQQEDFAYTVVPGKTMKRVNYSMLNLGVEAGFMYHLKGDRLMHKIGAGLSWQHGVKKSRHAESYDNAQSQYLFYQVFYRNEYVLNNRLNIFIQPFYKHVLVSSEVMEEPFKARPYYAGFSFGVVYRVR